MKIYIPKRATDNESTGGGFTFTRNIIKGLHGKVSFVSRWQDCDIYFIPGPTLAEKEEVNEVKKASKKIVLRIDNMVRNSRNRNTGTSRLFNFAQMADVVVYQSQWAKDFIMPFIKKDGPIIYNGVDTSIFKKEGDTIKKDGNIQYLYIRSSRDETKRWEKAWYVFQTLYFLNPDAHLWIVGPFSRENIEYNFDLFGGAEKRYKYWGVINDSSEMAKLYRSADNLLCTFSNDACSNIVAEAMASDLVIYHEVDSGGIKEQLNMPVVSIEEMSKKYLEIFQRFDEKI
jgi:glycosyltransferase involved in cell wall biosynthesis